MRTAREAKALDGLRYEVSTDFFSAALRGYSYEAKPPFVFDWYSANILPRLERL